MGVQDHPVGKHAEGPGRNKIDILGRGVEEGDALERNGMAMESLNE